MRMSRILAVAVLLAAAAPAARAELVYLKNGHEIEGWIVEESKAQVVIAIINKRYATVGKLTIDPADIQQIDRTRKESLEEALARYKQQLEAQQQEAARLALVQPTGATATAVVPPKEASSARPKGEKAEIPAPTPEQDEKIQAAIEGIGDTRKAGGAGSRREAAIKALIEVGIVAIPAINVAVQDANWYRRRNAALALAGIAGQDKRLKLYQESVPRMLEALRDGQPYVRQAANEALEAISGQSMGFTAPTTEELQPSELAVIDRWQKWWDGEQKKL